MFNDCLILAGGSGTRLWPASSSKLPKQFLPADEDKSFFSLALERALACTERVVIIAGSSHISHVIKDALKFTAAEKKRMLVIEEPEAKNTAPAVACAVVYSGIIERGSESGNMLVLTSDHIIKPLEVFKTDAGLASEICADRLVVFGIPPARPETGYGYIEAAMKNKEGNVFTAAAFHEKPDFDTAEKYYKNKRFFWNSGMFAFNTSFILQQFHSLAPELILPFIGLKQPKNEDITVLKGIKIINGWKGLKSAYKKVKNISFDCAIAEKCGRTAMIKVNFDWIDIGNWEEYIKLIKRESRENEKTPFPQVFNVDSDSCYVDSDIPVALAGVDDLIIVIRSGNNGESACALITRKGQTQKVRNIVEQIDNCGRKDLI